MTSISFQPFIEEVLNNASKIAMKNFGKTKHIETKPGDNNQVLTETDLEIGKYIISQISQKYPSHSIIDEETGVIDNQSEYIWVIDPIDGTSNFAAGIPTFGIILGLLKNFQPYAGGIALPFFNEIVLAEKGQGATCNNQTLRVTSEKNLLSSLVGYAIDGHQENPALTEKECQILAQIILKVRNLRAFGSAYDGIMVAKGKYGAYLNQTSKIWDNVGQHIIIEEAGGIYTDFFGYKQDYTDAITNSNKNYTWCMATPQLHHQLQTILK